MLRSIRKWRRGANAIEFALTLPVFLVVTFGMIEFGWYFSRVALLNSAVMDGCREGGLVDQATGDPAAEAIARMTAVLNTGGLTCTGCSASVPNGQPVGNKVLECSAEISYDGLTGWFSNLGVLSNTINTKTQVRLEWQRIDP